ncbi:MAG TPA: hypothetical protein VFP91_03440 [Vicinamibacterales bacterium]|nr:hypothetical protein [Vicinamibacterales bacterium]
MTKLQNSETATSAPGRQLWLAVALVALVAALLQSYGISKWPMADDEVPSLVEMGLIKVDAQAFSVPASQIGRLPRATPVWYRSQRFLIDHLPKSDVSYRASSVVYSVLTSIIIFLGAARWRGLWFGAAMALVMNTCSLFVYLAQLDRFYSLPLLLMVTAFALMWIRASDVWIIPSIAVLSGLAVLSHNVTLALFGLAFGASCCLFVVRLASIRLVARSAAALVPALLIYVFYLRPLVSGWASTGNPTPVLVSYVAYVTIPVLALALLGGWLTTVRRNDPVMLWWLLIFVAGVGLMQVAPISWNPRYFIFFLPATWFLAAHAVDHVAAMLGSVPNRLAWYACVMVLFAPSLLSHYVDGSRHDYRQAANLLIAHDRDRSPILSDDAETISYYLPDDLRRGLFVRTKVTHFPDSTFYLVARSNAWMPQPQFPGRQMDLIGEISKRRVDQFSHILRVYRVAAVYPQ